MKLHTYSLLFAIALLLSPLSIKAETLAEDTVVIRGGDVNEMNEPDNSEDLNRNIFGFNETLDDAFLAPVARGYRATIPQWGRNRISSAVDNLSAPVDLLNSALQGKGEKMLHSFWRFVLNTTFGIGGLFDFASAAGLAPVNEDFGQTLAVWSKDKSDYLVIPALGPSTNRDSLGFVVDTLTNPVSYIAFPAGLVVQSTKYISKRERLLDVTDEIKENSFDPYSTVRSAYFQNRTEEISK